MKTIYSILYINLNTTLNERVSIGVLLSNGENNKFKHSSEKLLAVKGLMEPERYNLIKSYLKSLENTINVIEDAPIGITSLKREWVTESYIGYLSKYSNNLIQFSEPKYIDIEFSFENFKRVFEKYVYAYEINLEIIQHESIYTKVKNILYPKIDTHVNLDMTLNSSHFENLFAPIEVNFIGVNGIPVAGQTIDFTKKHYFLENDITRFVSLTKAIEIEDKKYKGQYYVLGCEPETKNMKNHLLWEQIRDSEFLEFVDINEVGVVEEYIEKNNVRPYFNP